MLAQWNLRLEIKSVEFWFQKSVSSSSWETAANTKQLKLEGVRLFEMLSFEMSFGILYKYCKG